MVKSAKGHVSDREEKTCNGQEKNQLFTWTDKNPKVAQDLCRWKNLKVAQDQRKSKNRSRCR